MAQSILDNVKKMNNVAAGDDSFDADLVIHTNSVFSTLAQLGVGPAGGFSIADDSSTWDDFLVDSIENKIILNLAKTYIYLKVRLLFDQPASGFAIESYENQIAELTWRISVEREATEWTDPRLPIVL